MSSSGYHVLLSAKLLVDQHVPPKDETAEGHLTSLLLSHLLEAFFSLYSDIKETFHVHASDEGAHDCDGGMSLEKRASSPHFE